MGTYRRGTLRYSYRSIRNGSEVKKLYVGDGALAEFAERSRKLRYHQADRIRCRWKQEQQAIEAASREFAEFDKACNLLRDATLLALGFYRQDRHPWRKRQRGLRIFQPKEEA